MTNIMLAPLSKQESDTWAQTVRAAHYYVDQGALKQARDQCLSYVQIADDIPVVLNRATDQLERARSLANMDARIEATPAAYKAICESLATLVMAPVVVGFRLVYDANDRSFLPKPDGRIDLRAIDAMEDWLIYPSNLLKQGLNRHVRNSYSHNKYTLLDGNEIKLWDETPRGAISWGPETWQRQRIEALCEELLRTCSAVALALAIFGINHRRLIFDRGWMPAARNRPSLRLSELRVPADANAHLNGFDIKAFTLENGLLTIGLKTQPRGIDQIETLYTAGAGRPRTFKKPIRYEESPVVAHVMGVLQRIAGLNEDVKQMHTSVFDADGSLIGEFSIFVRKLEQAGGPATSSIEQDRMLADLDTLGSAMMWIRNESRVVEV